MKKVMYQIICEELSENKETKWGKPFEYEEDAEDTCRSLNDVVPGDWEAERCVYRVREVYV